MSKVEKRKSFFQNLYPNFIYDNGIKLFRVIKAFRGFMVFSDF